MANGHGGWSIKPTPWQCCFARSWASWPSLRPRAWSQAVWACWWQRQWCRTALLNSGVLSCQTWRWDWSGCIGKEREREGGWEYNPADGQIQPAVGEIMIVFPEYAGMGGYVGGGGVCVTTGALQDSSSMNHYENNPNTQIYREPAYNTPHFTYYVLNRTYYAYYTIHCILYALHSMLYILYLYTMNTKFILNVMHSNSVL